MAGLLTTFYNANNIIFHTRLRSIITSNDKAISLKRIFFIEMMGVPGSYDATVYDHFEDKGDEGQWFIKRFGQIPGISIETRNVCIGESLPDPIEVDGLVLAGTYNSVNDNTDWQRRIRRWLPKMREAKTPILAICGSHQLFAHMHDSDVVPVKGGPFAGTFPIQITKEGKVNPIMQGIKENDGFQYANSEHVIGIPKEADLLASSSEVPVAALDYGDHCYSTQFHPEGTYETLGIVWRNTQPELMENYHREENGSRLVKNFLNIVVNLPEQK
jgi:GMP synthase-like glutamine amidotransferase